MVKSTLHMWPYEYFQLWLSDFFFLHCQVASASLLLDLTSDTQALPSTTTVSTFFLSLYPSEQQGFRVSGGDMVAWNCSFSLALAAVSLSGRWPPSSLFLSCDKVHGWGFSGRWTKERGEMERWGSEWGNRRNEMRRLGFVSLRTPTPFLSFFSAFFLCFVCYNVYFKPTSTQW